MNLYIKFDINTLCRKTIQEQFDKLQVPYSLISFGEVEIQVNISMANLNQLKSNLSSYGIEIVENQKSILVQKIKDAIIEMVYMEDKLPTSKISSYLAEKVKHKYSYISNLFSDVTYTTIENYIILQKIERAKQLMIA